MCAHGHVHTRTHTHMQNKHREATAAPTSQLLRFHLIQTAQERTERSSYRMYESISGERCGSNRSVHFHTNLFYSKTVQQMEYLMAE